MSNRPTPLRLARGPLMVDVAGLALTGDERQTLCDPRVGGVILFARNFHDSAQLCALTHEIHALRDPALIVAVDHEGGRVQRFRGEGFTRLPAMRSLGRLWDAAPAQALELAHDCGLVLASELLAHGVDLSFTPVLDIDRGLSRAIGDRAFHPDPAIIAQLAQALAAGMDLVGMGCVGKHFPGHGGVEADSHHDIPVDMRDFDTLWNEDLLPYRHGPQLAGVMPAHVIYPLASPEPLPAGFSPFWLQQVLRQRLGFAGLIFSDDLNMEGARVAGDIVARACAAQAAGCDMLLVCNRPELVRELLACWTPLPDAAGLARLAALATGAAGVPHLQDPAALAGHEPYRQARARVLAIVEPQDACATALTAATIGEQRCEDLRQGG